MCIYFKRSEHPKWTHFAENKQTGSLSNNMYGAGFIPNVIKLIFRSKNKKQKNHVKNKEHHI